MVRAWFLSGALLLGCFLSACSGTQPSRVPSQASDAAALKSAPAAAEADKPLPKPTGECIIKPVMSDEDLYNCGATPRQPVIPR